VILLALLYNLAMAAVDAAAIAYLYRKRTASAWLAVCAASGIAAVGLAVGVPMLFGARLSSVFLVFGFARLLAYGLFLHGPVVLGVSAWLLGRARPLAAVGSAVLGVALLAVAVDAFLVEPHWLEVSRIRLTSAKLEAPVRIVVLADLQTDVIGPYERDVLRRLVQEEPDLILFAGDYLQAEGTSWERLRDELNGCLRELGLSAPCGAFAVRGNIDPGRWPGIFAGLPVTAVETTRSFELERLRLTCLSERDSFDPSLELLGGDSGRFHVVLGHCPNFALGRIEADLLVAGHTHGGQVQVPLVGPLVTLSQVPRGWAAGLTELPSGARLLVSRGVGMEGGGAPRLRFFCRPELVVLDLVPE
jgi:hypothetical protein